MARHLIDTSVKKMTKCGLSLKGKCKLKTTQLASEVTCETCLAAMKGLPPPKPRSRGVANNVNNNNSQSMTTNKTEVRMKRSNDGDDVLDSDLMIDKLMILKNLKDSIKNNKIQDGQIMYNGKIYDKPLYEINKVMFFVDYKNEPHVGIIKSINHGIKINEKGFKHFITYDFKDNEGTFFNRVHEINCATNEEDLIDIMERNKVFLEKYLNKTSTTEETKTENTEDSSRSETTSN